DWAAHPEPVRTEISSRLPPALRPRDRTIGPCGNRTHRAPAEHARGAACLRVHLCLRICCKYRTELRTYSAARDDGRRGCHGECPLDRIRSAVFRDQKPVGLPRLCVAARGALKSCTALSRRRSASSGGRSLI